MSSDNVFRHLRVSALLFLAIFPLTAEATTKRIDARNASESGQNQYFLVFSANPGVPGHAFVSWAMENNDRLVSESNAFGLYPKDKKTAWMGTVPGELVREVLKGNYGRNAHNLIVRVTYYQYGKAQQVRDQWAERGEYKLLDRDCVSFLSEVAAVIQLRVPGRELGTLRPSPFVLKLMELN